MVVESSNSTAHDMIEIGIELHFVSVTKPYPKHELETRKAALALFAHDSPIVGLEAKHPVRWRQENQNSRRDALSLQSLRSFSCLRLRCGHSATLEPSRSVLCAA